MNEKLGQNNPPEFTVEKVRGLFNQLNPRDQLLRLMLFVAMPREKRPSEDLTIAEREEEIIKWAETEGPGLKKLGEIIIGLIQKQSS